MKKFWVGSLLLTVFEVLNENWSKWKYRYDKADNDYVARWHKGYLTKVTEEKI